jgi:hypothetical protein
MKDRKFPPTVWFGIVCGVLSATRISDAAIIWDGPPITFTKPGFSDWTLPQNQDLITDLVSITRANTQGLFNIKVEASFTHLASPEGTEWAYGKAADFASLTFEDWEGWAESNPPSTVGKDAVLHLVDEDIYIDIKFTEWGVGSPLGGSFSYIRSTIPEPASLALVGAGVLCIGLRRRR